MTHEELKQYTESNEPKSVLRDEVGRWIAREWVCDKVSIVERYTYKYDVATLLSNKDITKYRNCFDIVSSELKEVING